MTTECEVQKVSLAAFSQKQTSDIHFFERFSFGQYIEYIHWSREVQEISPAEKSLNPELMVGRMSCPMQRVMKGGEAQFKALRCKCSNIICIRLSYLQVYFQHHYYRLRP